MTGFGLFFVFSVKQAPDRKMRSFGKSVRKPVRVVQERLSILSARSSVHEVFIYVVYVYDATNQTVRVKHTARRRVAKKNRRERHGGGGGGGCDVVVVVLVGGGVFAIIMQCTAVSPSSRQPSAAYTAMKCSNVCSRVRSTHQVLTDVLAQDRANPGQVGY